MQILFYVSNVTYNVDSFIMSDFVFSSLFQEEKKEPKKDWGSGGVTSQPRRTDLWGADRREGKGGGGKGDEWGRRKEGLRKVSTRRDGDVTFILNDLTKMILTSKFEFFSMKLEVLLHIA